MLHPQHPYPSVNELIPAVPTKTPPIIWQLKNYFVILQQPIKHQTPNNMKKLMTLFAFVFVAYTGNAQLIINGDLNYDGDLNITDVMKMIDIILGNTPKTYLNCPDDNHPHMIDLGLPSGTKWACCNVGASSPEAYGGYYAWGEISEKEMYSDVTYQYCTGEDTDGDGWYDQNWQWQNIGYYKGVDEYGRDIYDIADTQYDVAHVRWGGSWMMPSWNQIEELANSCTFTWTTINGVKGAQFIGPSGGKIFLPAAGGRYGYILDSNGIHAGYWSSIRRPGLSYGAYFLYFNASNVNWSTYFDSRRIRGFPVRPISK